MSVKELQASWDIADMEANRINENLDLWLLYKYMKGIGKVKTGEYEPEFKTPDCMAEALCIEEASLDAIDRLRVENGTSNSDAIAYRDKKTASLIETVVHALGHCVYQDRNATVDDGYGPLLGGMDSVFSGMTVDDDSALTADAYADTEYGGKLIKDLNPLAFNYTGYWTLGSVNTWGCNCERIMKQAANYVRKNDESKVVHIMNRFMYLDWLDNRANRDSLTIDEYSKSIGFSAVMSFNGDAVIWDYACPEGVGYCLNMDFHEFVSATSQPIYLRGPVWCDEVNDYAICGGVRGNFRWNPRYIVKYASYKKPV